MNKIEVEPHGCTLFELNGVDFFAELLWDEDCPYFEVAHDYPWVGTCDLMGSGSTIESGLREFVEKANEWVLQQEERMRQTKDAIVAAKLALEQGIEEKVEQ